MSVQVTFTLDFLSTYPMGFIPMQLSYAYPAIGEPNRGHTLELAPTTWAINSPESRKVMNRSANRDRLNLPDLSDDLKVHHHPR
jgi:hypothetical protein